MVPGYALSTEKLEIMKNIGINLLFNLVTLPLATTNTAARMRSIRFYLQQRKAGSTHNRMRDAVPRMTVSKPCPAGDTSSTKSLVPLMRFNMEEDFLTFRYTMSAEGAVKLDVVAWQDHRRRVATIFHTWAGGRGKEHCNYVHKFKLDFIKTLLDKIPSCGSSRGASLHLCEWFWLDTSGIPRKSNQHQDDTLAEPQECTSAWRGFKKIKRTTIIQIAYTFRKSDCSIVTNGGICNMDTSGKHVQVAMRILTTGWMRRLWTLQEVLSKHIKVGFKQKPGALGVIVDFDETIKSMTECTHLLKQKRMHNMMRNELETMIRVPSLVEPRGSDLMTNTWRAIHWRVI
ncbi:hypothetical protein PGQ11_010718 [Apiospora arundinis]|uniref:LAGLIDADG endonuclease n=1 Tax=Apiospora arundinis TaxID=335852 RepID=A0ABR2IBC2_9PEZI